MLECWSVGGWSVGVFGGKKIHKVISSKDFFGACFSPRSLPDIISIFIIIFISSYL